jgi:exonuclease III
LPCRACCDETKKNYGQVIVIWNLGKPMSCGVAILFHPRLIPDKPQINSDLEGRFQRLTAKIEGIEFNILNVYCPNEAKPRDEFLIKIIENAKDLTNLIIGGDFNCVENLRLDKISASTNTKKYIQSIFGATQNEVRCKI